MCRPPRIDGGSRAGGTHPDVKLLVDLPQSRIEFAVADDVVVNDVVAQCCGQALALGEDIVDAVLNDPHCATELALLGGCEGLCERVREDDVEVAAQVC